MIATRLHDKGLTDVQTCYPHYYDLGDVVVPLGEYPKQGMEKGQRYQVVGRDRDTLTVKSEAGVIQVVDPVKFRKSVYRPLEIEVAVGDHLRFRKNDRDKERMNGDEFTVMTISGTQATICRRNGKQEVLDLSQPQSIDHALVSTIYASQGKTADRALVSTDGKMFKENFYVAVSRVKRELNVYTIDKGVCQAFCVKDQNLEWEAITKFNRKAI
jgi:ATP-dependent exoDNAse (exonuclease V) alpha subunit